MKLMAKRKDVCAAYATIISVGYCHLQRLLSCEQPSAYTCGVYGWNADVYDFGDTAIVTGYRPFGNKHATYNLCRKYEQEASDFFYTNPDMHKAVNRIRLQRLIDDFIKEAKKERMIDFYNPSSREFVVIDYNPDSDSGGQFVRQHVPLWLSDEALKNTATSQEYYDYIDEHAQTDLIDKGTPEYDELMRMYPTQCETCFWREECSIGAKKPNCPDYFDITCDTCKWHDDWFGTCSNGDSERRGGVWFSGCEFWDDDDVQMNNYVAERVNK